MNADPQATGLWLRFLSGPDIDSLALSNADIVAAVEQAVRARYLARPDARVLGHVGSRGTAFWNVVLLEVGTMLRYR